MKSDLSITTTADRHASGSGDSVQIGLLHSLSGTMALSEKPLLDAEQMAIEEINHAGGVLGRRVEAIVADGASVPERFAQAAQELLAAGVSALFGCWTSAARKAVRPVVEAADSLLWYPVQYEGLEESPCICYTGSCLNQQIVPAVEWTLTHLGKRVFLIGSDYIFPRAANQFIRSLVEGQGGSIVAERYVDLGVQDFGDILAGIHQTAPDAVINTLNGDSNLALYRQCYAAGIVPGKIPILATSATETELESVAPLAAGHYACSSYFQSLDTPENRAFVRRFQAVFGAGRLVAAPMVMAYVQIYLWKQALERAGTVVPSAVRRHLPGCALASPLGELRVEANHHLSLPIRIGQLKADGQFQVVWENKESILPLPWLGTERLNFPGKALVRQSLAAYADHLHYASRLEHEIGRRKALEADLENKVAQRARQLKQTIGDLHEEIAERQRAQEALRNLNAQLEQRVRERTAQIALANQELEAFSYSVAHDLRAPLRAIDGFTQILLDDHGAPLGDQGKIGLQRVRAMTQRMDRLIDGLLQLSRYSRSELHRTTVDLSALARTVAEELRAQAPERAVELVIAPDLQASADPELMRVVMVNLLENAWKFTSKQPTAKIEFGRTVANGLPVFFVRDNGAGFDMAQANKLFASFQRLHSASDFPGTGIGLATVQRIILRHNGYIRAEGQVGQGATFYFTLPAATP